jgi:GH15 family glucan-1,4-alpha-glucosidase
VAYTAAASGHTARSRAWLGWLDAHRTAYGSLPEKVTASGRPAGPAPLLWTAALVLLTLDELDRR